MNYQEKIINGVLHTVINGVAEPIPNNVLTDRIVKLTEEIKQLHGQSDRNSLRILKESLNKF